MSQFKNLGFRVCVINACELDSRPDNFQLSEQSGTEFYMSYQDDSGDRVQRFARVVLRFVRSAIETPPSRTLFLAKWEISGKQECWYSVLGAHSGFADGSDGSEHSDQPRDHQTDRLIDNDEHSFDQPTLRQRHSQTTLDVPDAEDFPISDDEPAHLSNGLVAIIPTIIS